MGKKSNAKKSDGLYSRILKLGNLEFLKELIFNPEYLYVTCCLLVVFEIFLNVAIIRNVKYTEIDWIAYMQEVEGFLNGTLDYTLLKGDTGPLVYPAGFVYIYSVFYFLTSAGTNILIGQYIFLAVYILQLIAVFRIYCKTFKLPPYAVIISCLTSYRIHSIYVLRLFNDTIAVLLFYIALNAFISNKWRMGSLVYSLAVSVKMNILLYAPCLLVVYLTNLTYKETFINLGICALVQLILGAPFLYANPMGYLQRSFDIGRVFLYEWTVNYRFLSESVFLSRYLHIALLALHIVLLLMFLPKIVKFSLGYAKVYPAVQALANTKDKGLNFSKVVTLLILPFFVTNLIGIACARSLHYQFYCWYFHSLLYLGFCTHYTKPVVFCMLGIIEFCWNTYPSTALSSTMLHVCHVMLLRGVFIFMKA